MLFSICLLRLHSSIIFLIRPNCISSSCPISFWLMSKPRNALTSPLSVSIKSWWSEVISHLWFLVCVHIRGNHLHRWLGWCPFTEINMDWSCSAWIPCSINPVKAIKPSYFLLLKSVEVLSQIKNVSNMITICALAVGEIQPHVIDIETSWYVNVQVTV